MCRLFGQISLKAETAHDGLADDPHALLRLAAADPKRAQSDGWGVGWFAAGTPRVVKSRNPVYQEAGRLRRAARRAKSKTVIGHIRRLSNPRGLPRRALLARENNQPYAYKHLLFAHNGELSIPGEVERFLGAYRKKIKGNNDSEVFFWQFVKFYDVYGDVTAALEACVRETLGIWRGARARRRDKKRAYLGLNALVGDGEALYALCHFPAAPKARGLLSKRQIWGRMSYSIAGGRARVASEDLRAGRWRRLGAAELLTIRPRGGRLTAHRRRFTPGG